MNAIQQGALQAALKDDKSSREEKVRRLMAVGFTREQAENELNKSTTDRFMDMLRPYI